MWCGAIVWPPAVQCWKSNADHISSYINYLTVRHFQQYIVHKPYLINTTDFELWFGSSTFEIMKKAGKIADHSQGNIEICPNASFCEDLMTGLYIFTFADILYRSSIYSLFNWLRCRPFPTRTPSTYFILSPWQGAGLAGCGKWIGEFLSLTGNSSRIDRLGLP